MRRAILTTVAFVTTLALGACGADSANPATSADTTATGSPAPLEGPDELSLSPSHTAGQGLPPELRPPHH